MPNQIRSLNSQEVNTLELLCRAFSLAGQSWPRELEFEETEALALLCRAFFCGGLIWRNFDYSEIKLGKDLVKTYLQLIDGDADTRKRLEDFILACHGNPPDTK